MLSEGVELVAIISGRSIDDLNRRLGLPEVVLVGNHGLVLQMEGVLHLHPLGVQSTALIDAACQIIEERLRATPGCVIEHKGLTASVHYRLAKPQDVHIVLDEVQHAVREAAPLGGLVLTQGKRVLEIRPDVEWNKGNAVEWLMEHQAGHEWWHHWTVVYLGDDRTDEPAFATLRGHGIGIRVGVDGQPTEAALRLADPEAVEEFLRLLVASAELAHQEPSVRPPAME